MKWSTFGDLIRCAHSNELIVSDTNGFKKDAGKVVINWSGIFVS